MGIIKSGKVVILTAGRFAGRKAVVVKTSEDGNQSKKFGHALVAGVDRYPRKVTRAMGKKKAEKRSKVKPFIKIVNFSHLMPTRYSVDIDLKKAVDENSLAENNRASSRKAVKKIFEDRYRSATANKSEKKAAGTQYFFEKLKF